MKHFFLSSFAFLLIFSKFFLDSVNNYFSNEYYQTHNGSDTQNHKYCKNVKVESWELLKINETYLDQNVPLSRESFWINLLSPVRPHPIPSFQNGLHYLSIQPSTSDFNNNNMNLTLFDHPPMENIYNLYHGYSWGFWTLISKG